MEKEKKEKLVRTAQIGTVVAYVFLILHSTVGEYVKLMKKNIRKDAKRKEKLKKQKYAKKKRELKRRQKRQGLFRRSFKQC